MFKYLCFLIFFLIHFISISQSHIGDRLHIKGKVLHSTGKVKNVSIRIVHDDGVIDTVFAKNGKYNLHLELNHKILLEFECIDVKHYTKRIAFNTNVPKNTKRIPYFDLTINLVEMSLFDSKENDTFLLDVPVGFLTYDSKKGVWFDSNAKYSRVINTKLKAHGIY
tara:strand:+ start:17166 stop:17663 length:498 start_codon:yes stop_codon:yes gene_type:complete